MRKVSIHHSSRSSTEIEGLLENVTGAGLRLNARGGARVVTLT